jgi:hypothetical protein
MTSKAIISVASCVWFWTLFLMPLALDPARATLCVAHVVALSVHTLIGLLNAFTTSLSVAALFCIAQYAMSCIALYDNDLVAQRMHEQPLPFIAWVGCAVSTFLVIGVTFDAAFTGTVRVQEGRGRSRQPAAPLAISSEPAAPSQTDATVWRRADSPAAATQEEREDARREVVRDCAVCLEPLRNTQPLFALPCAHVYHEACIRRWMLYSHECPMCHTDILAV